MLGHRRHPGNAIFCSMLTAAVVNSIAKLPPAHFTVQGLEVILCHCSSCLNCLSTRLGWACFFCQRDCHSCLPQMSYAKDGPELPHDIAFSTYVSRLLSFCCVFLVFLFCQGSHAVLKKSTSCPNLFASSADELGVHNSLNWGVNEGES